MKLRMTFCFLTMLSLFTMINETVGAHNNQRALAIVNDAVEVSGGEEAIAALESIRAKLKGQLLNRDQSYHPEKPVVPLPAELGGVLDFTGKRLTWDQDIEYPGGFRFHNRFIRNGDEGSLVSLLAGTVSPLPGPASTSWDLVERFFPPLILKRALTNRESLKYEGAKVEEGNTYDVISFSWNPSLRFTLYFNQKTHLLAKNTIPFFDVRRGDHTMEFLFQDYRDVSGFKFPMRHVRKQQGEVVYDLDFEELSWNVKPKDSLFSIPEGMTYLPQRDPQVKKLGEDIYVLQGLGGGLYNVFFVAFDKYLLVVDLPLGSPVAAPAIEKILDTVPGKPIRYGVFTHYHRDHTGGLRTLVSLGAEIVTTRGNKSYLEEMAAAPYRANPDSLAKDPKHPGFIFVDQEKHSISDGKKTAEIIKLKPTPHVEEMLLVYIPERKLLLNGDLYSNLVPVNETMSFFVTELDRLNLDVETVAGVHHDEMTTAEIRKNVAEWRRTERKTEVRTRQEHPSYSCVLTGKGRYW